MYAQRVIDATSKDNLDAHLGMNISEAQGNWEAELDAMGTEANLAEYEAHLAKAPDPTAETTNYLKGFVAAKSQPF